MLSVLNIPLAFLVPSSSGHAALAMPIIAPLSDFADVQRSLAVTVNYNKYLRFIAPLLHILFVLILGFVALGVLVG